MPMDITIWWMRGTVAPFGIMKRRSFLMGLKTTAPSTYTKWLRTIDVSDRNVSHFKFKLRRESRLYFLFKVVLEIQ